MSKFITVRDHNDDEIAFNIRHITLIKVVNDKTVIIALDSGEIWTIPESLNNLLTRIHKAEGR
jgi:hypothetical protein